MTTAPLTFHKTSIGISAWHRHWVDGQITGRATVPCGDCSACCSAFGRIPLSTGDDPSIYRTSVYRGVLTLEKHDDGSCIYLVNNQCSIYDRRPVTCRMFDCRVFYPLTAEEATLFGGELLHDLHQIAHQRFDMTMKEPDDFTFTARLKAQFAELFARITVGELREAGPTSLMMTVLLSLSPKAQRLWQRGRLNLPDTLKAKPTN